MTTPANADAAMALEMRAVCGLAVLICLVMLDLGGLLNTNTGSCRALMLELTATCSAACKAKKSTKMLQHQ